MQNPQFAVFTVAEHRERVARARKALAAEGYDGAVCIGAELLNYLGGFDCCSYFSPQALIFATKGDDDPILLVRNIDVINARETSWLPDVQDYQLNFADPLDIIAGIARDIGMGAGRIAVDFGSYACTARYGFNLVEALASATLDDATVLFSTLQFQKSEAELVHIRQAGKYADIGWKAAQAVLRVGMTEIELAAEVEHAMRSSGSEFSALATLCATGARTPGMHSTPTNKKIEDGDVVHMEFAGVSNRYHAVSMFTFAAGEPSPLVRELYELGNETLAAAMAECAPGKPIGGMETASLGPVKRAGREKAYMAMFGTGLGVGYPPIWVGALTINRWSDKILAPGMVFYAHSCLQFVDEGIGITQGGSYLVTQDGYEPICGPGQIDLFVA
ncbi:MAG: aminopeptidase P family protein [Rhodobacteraceae bacterium]|nr:aminopeptidase P family protein [Paracoccaceae bacterium]